jgi:hypothetical protein
MAKPLKTRKRTKKTMDKWSLIRWPDGQYVVQMKKTLPNGDKLTLVQTIDADVTIESLHSRLVTFLKDNEDG